MGGNAHTFLLFLPMLEVALNTPIVALWGFGLIFFIVEMDLKFNMKDFFRSHGSKNKYLKSIGLIIF